MGDGNDPDLTSTWIADLARCEEAQGLRIKLVFLDQHACGKIVGGIAGIDGDAGLQDGGTLIEAWCDKMHSAARLDGTLGNGSGVSVEAFIGG